jgi:hypothetical protein
MTIMRSEQILLSKLDDKPCFYYHPRSDTKICYWNGIAMTKGQATAIIARTFGFSWITKEMQHRTWDEYVMAYKLGAFGPVDWDRLMLHGVVHKDNHIDKLAKWLNKGNSDFTINVSKKYTKQEALAWLFDTDLPVID